MKKQTLLSLTLASALVLTAPLSMGADVVPSAPNQMSKVLEVLQGKGYAIVKEIEFNDSNGMYNAKVVNAEGKNLKVQVDPKANDVSMSKNAVEGISAMDVAKKVEAAGFPMIYKIDTEIFGNQYEVKVMDKDGKKMDLKVDAKSGNINK